jgi:hypothetical protein
MDRGRRQVASAPASFLYSVQLKRELFPGRNDHPLGQLSLSGPADTGSLFLFPLPSDESKSRRVAVLAFVRLRPRRSSSGELLRDNRHVGA